LVIEREEYTARAEALSAELQNRQPPQQQYTPAEQQAVVAEWNQARERLAEEEKSAVQNTPTTGKVSRSWYRTEKRHCWRTATAFDDEH
jgi:hypothetical protein